MTRARWVALLLVMAALYFAAPRLYYAHSNRVAGIVPSVLRPPALWNADQLSITSP